MAPRTRQRNTTRETLSVVPSTGMSVVESLKKSRKKKTHRTQESTLPQLTIKVPSGVAELPVILGKRALSPEEGPQGNQGRATPEEVEERRARKQRGRGKRSTATYPPLLEVADEEDSTLGQGNTDLGPRTKKLRQMVPAEILTINNDSSTDDSSSNGSSTKSSTDTSNSDSANEEEERANLATLAKATQTSAFSKRIMIERPSWSNSTTVGDNYHGNKETTSTLDCLVTSSTSGEPTLPCFYTGYGQAESPPSFVGCDHNDPYPLSDAGLRGTTSELPSSLDGIQAMPSHSKGRKGADLRLTAFHGHQAMSADSDSQHSPFQEWPAETDLVLNEGKMRLKDQSAVVQDTVTASFPYLHAFIVLDHAFPDGVITATFIMHALLSGTSHVSNSFTLRHRIAEDHIYLSKLVPLPRARISIFWGQVKERCAAAVALLVNVHSTPAIIADLIHMQVEDNYDYIFPRCGANTNILAGPPLRSQPYRSSIIISVIRDIFFTGPTSFVMRHKDRFPTYIATGDVIQEVPKAMVALVATALFAALKEWASGRHKHQDFSANSNLDAYKGHINSLNKIEATRKGFYHRMMGDIFQLASSSNGQPALPVPELDLAAVDFDEVDE